MALGSEPDADLRLAFQDLRELKVDVAYPFLLKLYHDYKANALSKADLLASVRLVEAYVFRRAICGIPTNSMNQTFATFTKVLKKDRYFESIQAHFLEMRSYRRFPTDEEFHRDLQTRDLYNFRSRSYWLRRVENYDRRERVVVEELPSNIFCRRTKISRINGARRSVQNGSVSSKHGCIRRGLVWANVATFIESCREDQFP